MHSGQVKPGYIDPDLYQQIVSDLTTAVTSGFNSVNPPDTKPYKETINALLNSVHKFSGFKTDAQIKDAAKLMLDTDGNIRPFNAFKKDILALNHEYNVTWLKTEYNQAIANSQMAGKWVNIEQDADTLPLLMYHTVNDERVRDEHKALNQIIKPINDPFWKTHYPPNGWGCRCDVMQLHTGVITDLKDVALPEIPVGFRTNVGITKEALSAEHTYAKGLTKGAKNNILKQVGAIDKNTYKVLYSNNNARVEIALSEINQSGFEDNLEIGKILADKKAITTILLPRITDVQKVKSPDARLIINEAESIWEFKTNYAPTYTAIDNQLREAKSKARNIVLHVKSSITLDTLFKAIENRLKNTKSVDTLIIIFNNVVYEIPVKTIKDKTYRNLFK